MGYHHLAKFCQKTKQYVEHTLCHELFHPHPSRCFVMVPNQTYMQMMLWCTPTWSLLIPCPHICTSQPQMVKSSKSVPRRPILECINQSRLNSNAFRPHVCTLWPIDHMLTKINVLIWCNCPMLHFNHSSWAYLEVD